METLNQNRTAVVRGAEYLDREKPGWWQLVNEDILDISSGTNCILGQIYGSFWSAPVVQAFQGASIGALNNFVNEYGFEIDDANFVDSTYDASYTEAKRQVEQQWYFELIKRRYHLPADSTLDYLSTFKNRWTF